MRTIYSRFTEENLHVFILYELHRSFSGGFYILLSQVSPLKKKKGQLELVESNCKTFL